MGEPVSLAEGVNVIHGELRGRFPYAHALLIQDDMTVLIDTGAGDRPLGSVPATPDVIINSHFHADHTRGNRLFPDAAVWAAAEDAPAIRSEDEFVTRAGYTRMGPGRARLMLDWIEHAESRVDRELAGDEVLELGRRKLRLIPAPGHTPGHLAFYLEREGILFTADVDLTSFGPWYANPGSDPDQFEDSIRRLAEVPARLIVSAHKGILREELPRRLEMYRAVIDARDQRCLELLARGPATLGQLARHWPIHGRPLQPGWLYGTWERIMLEHQLVRLQRRGLVRAGEDGRMERVAGA
ncbi:MAG: MBL fold metallo-hydrolase [bacterium]|nr:MBL fold metallo-hydrolase [bacterium]